MGINADIYIARQERGDAIEAYANRMTPEQIQYLRETDGDFWFKIKSDGTTQLLLVEDEG